MAKINIKGIDSLKKYREAFSNLKDNYIKAMKKLIDDAIPIAIETAEQATPPNVPDSGGTGTLAKAWKRDSDKKSKLEGKKISFKLANNTIYAYWVDQGHNLTRHFVPGLHIIGGELVFDKSIKGGIIVGTKTKFVKGFYMADKAKKAFYKFIKQHYKERVKEVWEQSI